MNARGRTAVGALGAVIVAAATWTGWTFLMYNLALFTVVARLAGQHIEYVSPHFFAAAVMSLGPILSTHRIVRVFGVLALLSFAAVYYFYATWFISVWCLFAAMLSAVILVHGRTHRSAATVR